MLNNLIFHQLFEKESSTYTYLLADPVTKEAVIIDPVLETVERDSKLIEELGVKLKYILETHVHADHITGSGLLRQRTGARIALSTAYSTSCPDIGLDEGDKLIFGNHEMAVLSTPGHTNGCMTYLMDNMAFTGDALLIRGCGRTDFQEGSSERLFQSVREKIFSLSDDTLIFPAHDYKGLSHSTVGEEKKFNQRLNLSIQKETFIKIMSELKLSYPKKIQEAVPANLTCGLDVVPTIWAEDIHSRLNELKIIDVRTLEEFRGELGHIPGAELKTLGEDLSKVMDSLPQEQEIIFVCRSGKRSAEATKLAHSKGFKKVFNLSGGMLRWNELKLPTVT